MKAEQLAGRVRRDGGWIVLETEGGRTFYDIPLADFASPSGRAVWWRVILGKARWQAFVPAIAAAVRDYLAEQGPVGARFEDRVRWVGGLMCARRLAEGGA
jgi:hypothetical protein